MQPLSKRPAGPERDTCTVSGMRFSAEAVASVAEIEST